MKVSEETEFKLNFNKAVKEFNEANAVGIQTHPVILGPISFLVFSKATKEADPSFQPISLSHILPVYKHLFTDLKSTGAEWVQVNEPILVLNIATILYKECLLRPCAGHSQDNAYDILWSC